MVNAMQKQLEASGKTIDAAIQSALDTLGLDRDSVTVEVLEKPKSGFLGLGGSQARVLVSYALSRKDKAETFLSGLLQRMSISASVQVTETGEGHLEIDLSGVDNKGLIIGRRGETLDAIQHLTNYAVNKNEDTPVRVTVDCQEYRKKRAETVEQTARRAAEKATEQKRNVVLQPMNAFERHLVHTVLQDMPGISTYSTGSDPYRRVVVSVAGGRPASGSGNLPRGPNRRRHFDKR